MDEDKKSHFIFSLQFYLLLQFSVLCVRVPSLSLSSQRRSVCVDWYMHSTGRQGKLNDPHSEDDRDVYQVGKVCEDVCSERSPIWVRRFDTS